MLVLLKYKLLGTECGSQMNNVALIVAAGRGSRMMQSLPKQYLLLNNEMILSHTIKLFVSHNSIDAVVVVINKDDLHLYDKAIFDISSEKLLPPSYGGNTRAASVRLGLEDLSKNSPHNVIIHDAARPLCPPNLLDAVLAPLNSFDGAFAALPVMDALWKIDNGCASHPINRENVWRAQTPQAFQFQKILEAHSHGDESAKDDVEVALLSKLNIIAIHGSEINFKITTPEDLRRAEAHFE